MEEAWLEGCPIDAQLPDLGTFPGNARKLCPLTMSYNPLHGVATFIPSMCTPVPPQNLQHEQEFVTSRKTPSSKEGAVPVTPKAIGEFSNRYERLAG